MRVPPLAIALLLAHSLSAGCSKKGDAPPTTEPEPLVVETEPAHGLGASLEEPVPRCGAADSYRWIARDFRCVGGENPFGGDADAAAHARVGSTQSVDNSHFIDIYRVPCAEGERTVYVDMYACPYQEAPQGEVTEVFDTALAHLDAGDFDSFLRSCDAIIGGDAQAMDQTYCIILTPAVLALSGDQPGAVTFTQKLCASLPPPSEQSSARADFMQTIAEAFSKVREMHPGVLVQADIDAVLRASRASCGLGDP